VVERDGELDGVTGVTKDSKWSTFRSAVSDSSRERGHIAKMDAEPPTALPSGGPF